MSDSFIQPLVPPPYRKRSKGLLFTLEPDPPTPRTHPAEQLPSPSPTKQPMNLDKWKEDDDDEWGEPVGKAKVKVDEPDEEAKKKRAVERIKRTTTSESWDDDFDFQHAPAPPHSPSSRKTSSSSRMQSRSVTPSNPPASPTTPAFYASSPSAYTDGGLRVPQRTNCPNASLDSLASSFSHSPTKSDYDPTLTFAVEPTSSNSTPKHRNTLSRSHRPSASIPAVPSLPPSQQATPRSRIPRTSTPPIPHHRYTPSSSHSRSRASPPTEDDFRSTTPSLTEDSLHSLTAGEELDTDGDDERVQYALAPSQLEKDELGSSGGSLFSGLRSASGSRKWRFGRRVSTKEKERERAKEREQEQKQQVSSAGVAGRRTGPREPEVMVIDREELERDSAFDEVRSRLPKPTRPSDGAFVVLGQRTRTSAGTTSSGGSSIPLPTRQKHSSNASSTTTNSSGNASIAGNPPRSHRSSLNFLTRPFESFTRRPSIDSTLSPPPTASSQPPPSWREYDGTTSEDGGEDDGGETTGAELSEFSGDDATSSARFSHARGRGRAVPRGTGHRAGMRSLGQGTVTPSTSFMTSSTRPVSPVESILGVDKSRWNSSQVSFASTAGAFSLRANSPERTSTAAGGGFGGETIQGRKKKLTKRRVDEAPTLTSSPSAVSFASSAGGTGSGEFRSTSTRTLQRPPRPPKSHYRQEASLPFAQESEDEAIRRRTVRQRSVTSPEGQQQELARTAAHRQSVGGIVEMSDQDGWVGVVPFPPTDTPPLDGESRPQPPSSSSSTSLRPQTPSRSKFLRKVSGSDKSHPPITARTQAEAKQKRGGNLSASISNMLSRSTSALPLGGRDGEGKRAPSPAPSMKSSRSSKSLLARTVSGRKKQDGEGERGISKSPSLGLLRKRTSVIDSPPPLPSPASSGSSTRPPPQPTSPVPTKLPQSESHFSFFHSRRSNTVSSPPPPPGSPAKPSAARASTSEQSPRPSMAQKRSSLVRSRPSNALSSENPRQPSPRRQPPTSGQLNQGFQMPARPHSTVSSDFSNFSNASSNASTITPLSGFRDATLAKAMRSATGPPISGASTTVSGGGLAIRPKRPAQGHRPSVSLSSIMPLRSESPRPRPPPAPSTPPPVPFERDSTPSPEYERPRTALGGERPPTSYFFDEDLAITDSDFILPRRNSLSDLRIPQAVTDSQKKIEKDLERVKQFAKGIEDLKALRRQYDQLIQIFVEPPPVSTPSADRPSSLALTKTASAIRPVELDYSSWWEQAQTLIDLGDGKPSSNLETAKKTSPGTLASRRDRCISLAPETTPTKKKTLAPVPTLALSGSETETEESFSAGAPPNPALLRRPFVHRQASTSSIATEMSVEARQREMLRGVLTPTSKGASLPSRGPPAPRPDLSALAQVSTTPRQSRPPSLRNLRTSLEEQQALPRLSAATPRRAPLGTSRTVSPTGFRQPPPVAPPRTPSYASRRVSRVGVFGIREFLLRLRSKATEELAASVGTLPVASLPPSTVSSSHHHHRKSTLSSSSALSTLSARRSVSDPASRPHTPSSSFSRRPIPSALNPSSLHGAVGRRRSTSSSTGGNSSDSGSDWDAELSPPRREDDAGVDSGEEGLGSMRRRTLSVGMVEGGAGGVGKMILTTEAMPSLVEKVKEVREKCEACVGVLRGLTI